MKKVLGLDLGTTSIGWALVEEAEKEQEVSSITRLGVRVNPLTVDELSDFEKGKSITTNADRTLKRSMRRNLQRYKLRREALVEILKENGFITDQTLLSESGNRTTFETYRLRAKAAAERVSLEEFARVLLMINKKRGYRSSRKAKDSEEGSLIDGMEIAKKLYEENLTPGQFCLQLLKDKKNYLPDFYRSDLQTEFDRIWLFQKQFYPDMLTDQLKDELRGRNKKQTGGILFKYFSWQEAGVSGNGQEPSQETSCKLVGIKRQTKGKALQEENFQWRVAALSEKLHPEKLAVVFQEINGQIAASSGYLGAISDRSKELFFHQQTVGQYQMSVLAKNPHASLKNMVFYRQDYLDEFNTIWEKQAEFYPILTEALKREIRDVVIFYQRRLKSQKGLIGICELEQEERAIQKDGKTKVKVVGYRVAPRSSPFFQEFKIWQRLNDIEVSVVGKKQKNATKARNLSKKSGEGAVSESSILDERRFLYQEEKEMLAKELFVREEMKKADVLKLLFDNYADLDMNFKSIHGNQTGAALYRAYSRMIEMSGHDPLDFKKPASEIMDQAKAVFEALGWCTDILYFDSGKKAEDQAYFRLWHLLYSFEGDTTLTGHGKLIDRIHEKYHIDKEYAGVLVNTVFESDYGNLSTKAIGKILPYLKEGNAYSDACLYAGYRHSSSSLTKEEIENKVLKEKLEILPKNSLRNPVVEKILNQMIHVVNSVIDVYGRPDEIRVELARELKKNAKEREELTKAIAENTRAHDTIRKILQTEFGLTHVSRNDIIRYKLYEELRENGYKTLYSDQYIPREKLFSKEIDIEHIIPQARLFDDSLSNKTLEYRAVNIEKGNKTARDFVLEKYGEEALEVYESRCEAVFAGYPAKLRKLKMSEEDIPEGFIDRDLRNTQYIAKKALSMLNAVCRRTVATTGSITDELRQSWQLVDVMKELNWEKYKELGLVEYFEDKDGRKIGRIKDWTKRNDHRHHAMDALTVAFTKDVFIQYFNHKNASFKSDSNEFFIKNKYFENGVANPPIMPLSKFREQAKEHLKNTLISIKSKNKVTTQNVNKIKTGKGKKDKKVQSVLTPRGQLHLETVYGSSKQYVVKEEKVNAAFDRAKIASVSRPVYREALLRRLNEYGGDPKKAFTGKNALDKNPVWIDEKQTVKVPEKVKLVSFETVYTIRKPIDENLSIEKVIDPKIRMLLTQRKAEYGNDAKKAFSNLDENPIWLNKEQGISVKRVSIRGISNAQSLHEKRDKEGAFVLDTEGQRIPVDFVSTGNNHHVAVYRKPVLDKNGNLEKDENGGPKYAIEEKVVSFFDAVVRVNLGYPVIDKDYKKDEGWQFLYSMKQNEYFVFPNDETGFDPKEIDLMDPRNYSVISPNLFRVQKFTHKNYVFRHHLETTVSDTSAKLRGITWTDFRSSKGLDRIVKVRLNHLGDIVAVGER